MSDLGLSPLAWSLWAPLRRRGLCKPLLDWTGLDWSCWTYLLVASNNLFVIFMVFSQDGGRKLFPRSRRSSRPCHSRRWAELWLTRRRTNRARGDWEGNSCAQLRHWECFLPLLTERVITPESFRAAPRFGCAADILHPVCFGATLQCCK